MFAPDDRFFSTLVDLAADAVVVVDGAQRIVYVNESATAVFGYSKQELIGSPLDVLLPEDVRDVHRPLVAAFGASGLPARRMGDRNPIAARHKDGHTFPADVAITAVSTPEGPILAAIVRDISETKRLEADLIRLASTDSLTGLLNRRAFLEAADREMRRARRYSDPLSVLMLDLDFFKQINDRYGHARGDDVLQQFASLCRSAFREHDLIGRWGGEEFAVLLINMNGAQALVVAERLRRRVQNDVILQPDDPVSVSIGIAVAEPTDTAIGPVLAKADAALYAAKAAGRNCVRLDVGADAGLRHTA